LEPWYDEDYAVMGKCHSLITAWFALARSRRLALSELSSEREAGKQGPIGIGINIYGCWPTPFSEISKVVEYEFENIESDTGPAARSEVIETIKNCLKGFHLDEGASCKFGKDPPCLADRGRKQMADLVRLSPLRVLRGDSGRMEPWEAGNEDYDSLSSISDYFALALKFDSLNDKSLTVWFAENFWRDCLNDEAGRDLATSDTASRAEKAKMFSNSARVAQFALQNMPPDNRTVEALLWAVEKYANDTLKLNPRFEIGMHLLRAARNEPALHALKPHYRDHFFHAIEVCFLGHLLLDTEYEPGKRLIELVQRITRLRSREEVLRAWYLAALLHDVGYAIDVLKGASAALKFFECSGALKSLAKGIENAIDELSVTLKDAIPGVSDLGRDHGVVGAEHLQHLIRLVSAEQSPWRGYDLSVRAIRSHNLHSQTVVFEEEPLSFLLVLCDLVQEWNRPHLRSGASSPQLLAALIGAEAHEAMETTGPLDRVSVNLERRNGQVALRNPGQVEFELNYGPAIQKNAGVFEAWLNTSSNLQRLKPHGLPFNIFLRLRTPQFRTAGRVDERQMNRLRQAAEETHMSFLADWFPDARTNKAVVYSVDKDNMEVLELNLRELSARRRIRADMASIRHLLATWRHYNDDRDFARDYAPENPGYPFKMYPA
jgi:hypothetical protein